MAEYVGDRLTTSVSINFNKQMTQKQMEYVLSVLKERFEDAIMESPKLTEQIGHVHIGSPFGSGLEICV